MSEAREYIDENAEISDRETKLTMMVYSGDQKEIVIGSAAGPELTGFDTYRDKKEEKEYIVQPIEEGNIKDLNEKY